MADLTAFSSKLGVNNAAHLLRRTTFHLSKERIDYFANLTPMDAVNQLFMKQRLANESPIDPSIMTSWLPNVGNVDNMVSSETKSNRRKYVKVWWLDEARRDQTIYHKLQFFLHTVFPVDLGSGQAAYLYGFDHLKLLRYYSLNGDFRALAKKMITDNMMLSYLDNGKNRVGNVNENFAREFLELHTILKGVEDGVGSYTNYTELDVQESARLLTGFRVDKTRSSVDIDTSLPRGLAKKTAHDKTTKTFSAKFQSKTIQGGQNEEEMFIELFEYVDLIFAQYATAQNLVRRIYRFFVRPNISNEVEVEIIDPLAREIFNPSISGQYFNIHYVLKKILISRHFYDLDDSEQGDKIIGALLKSPIDLFLNMMTLFSITPPEPTTQDFATIFYKEFYGKHISNSLLASELSLFQPPTVAGYPAYHQEPLFTRHWFSAASILGRYNLPKAFIDSKFVNKNGQLRGNTKVSFDFVDFVRNSGMFSDPSNAELLVQEFIKYTLPVKINSERFNYFLNLFLDDLSPINWQIEWQKYMQSNDESAVKIPLRTLFISILYSEEFQIQ